MGTTTGGGAFVTIPFMIWLGIPPQVCVASSRVSAFGSLIAGLRQFHKHKKVDYKLSLEATAFCAIGTVIGAVWLTKVSPEMLSRIVGWLILVLLPFSYIRSTKQGEPIYMTWKRRLVGYSALCGAGVLGGFFGGQASLATFVFQIIFGKSLTESIGTRKLTGILTSTLSLLIYGMSGMIDLGIGCALFAGTLIGSFFGAGYALAKGEKWIQRLYNTVLVLLAARMILY